MQITKPSENRYVKGLFFAPAGNGKTVLIGTAELDERTSPMCLLDFEGGTESLAGLDVVVIPIRTWDDYNEAYEALANGSTIDGIDFSQFKSVGIDSISETHKFALLDILRRQGHTRKDPDLLEQRDYGTATVQMRRLLREFRDLPMHVFFTAHAKEVEIPREGRVRVPDLAGQLAEEVSGLVSVQGYLAQYEDDGELHRTLLLHSFPKFRIKIRTPWGVQVPEEIVDPTVTDLLDLLNYGNREVDLTQYKNRGSSKGKELVEEEVKVDLDGTALPGTPEPEVKEEKTDETREEEAVASGMPNGQAVGATEEDATELPNFQRMTINALRDWAAEHQVDLGEAKTRRQMIEVLNSLEGVPA